MLDLATGRVKNGTRGHSMSDAIDYMYRMFFEQGLNSVDRVNTLEALEVMERGYHAGG